MRIVVLAFLLGLGLAGSASAAEMELTPANTNIENVGSLQRGAKYFVNYCLGCHSAKYVRYNRLANDLVAQRQGRHDAAIGERKPLATVPIPDTYLRQGETRSLRPYQMEAMQALDRTVELGKRRFLISVP